MRMPSEFEVSGVAHATAVLGDFTAHVAQAGDGDPVVLLHGWPQHWWAWRHLIGPLADDGRRVICPDLRGFGWSECPGYGYAAEQFAADLIELLDALDLERVDLVGHDWGAYTAFIACHRHPERFGRLVAMGSPSPLMKLTPRLMSHLWRYWYQQVLAAPVIGPRVVSRLGSPRNIVARWIGLHRLRDDEISAYVRQFEDPARVRASVALYRQSVLTEFVRPFRAEFRRGRLSVPTLVLHGREDRPTHRALVEVLANHADRVEIDLLDGLGHFLLEEAPEAVGEAIRSFLSRRER
jgi:pimeloyl-ACP methyl ester carboxylesterase